jgi:dTDP-glucose 4,6-dehydratase
MANFSPKKLLVTGGAGFIGANFIHYWQQQYPEQLIVNLDALTYASSLKNLENLPCPEQHIFVQGDINDQALIEQLLRTYELDTVVHFAAESHVDNSIKDPAVFVKTNVLGTYTLLEAARKVWLTEKNWQAQQCRFHHISTDEVYGTLGRDDLPFTETTKYAPNSPYSASKAGSDHLVRAYFHTYGLPTTLSNCSNNYGPRMHGEKFIPTVIRACLNEQPIPIYGDGTNIRDWLYVDDHCRAVAAILYRGKTGETYNVGGHNELDNLTLAQRLCGLLDAIKPRAQGRYIDLLTFVTDRPGHDWRYAIDSSKIQRELGWQAQGVMDLGLQRVIEWFL